MIYAVYLNPTIDKTVYLDQLEVGGTNRPDQVLIQEGKSSEPRHCRQPAWSRGRGFRFRM